MSRNLQQPRGPIAWMASHPVAANLLMFALIAGGIFSAMNIKTQRRGMESSAVGTSSPLAAEPSIAQSNARTRVRTHCR